MPERDPYPMTSTEAKALEASVEAKGQSSSSSKKKSKRGKKWNSMNTESQVDTSKVDAAEEDEASRGLVAKKKAGVTEDDIYANTDRDDEDKEDPLLDVPLDELRGSPVDRFWGSAKRSLLKLYRRLYGDKLPLSEMLRMLCLATTLFFMIGGYWLLRSLKDSVLMALCGYKAIPKAKMLSVFVVLGVVSVYNHLLDLSLIHI